MGPVQVFYEIIRYNSGCHKVWSLNTRRTENLVLFCAGSNIKALAHLIAVRNFSPHHVSSKQFLKLTQNLYKTCQRNNLRVA